MSFFLTATDTGVGKTTAAAMLLLRYMQLLYWKPVQTGNDLDRLCVERLAEGRLDKERLLQESFHFSAPLSPHRAAELEGKQISLQKLLEDLRKNQEKGPLLIEGAGGILVPLTRKQTWIDFLLEANLPVVIAARTALGTINHSLLTIQACQKENIPILGLIFCGPINKDNCRTICEISGVPQLCCFDYNEEKDLRKISSRDFGV